DLDRIEVDVVVRRSFLPLRLAGRRRVRLVEPDRWPAVPLPQDLAGRNVDLLDDAVEDPALLRSADGGQVDVELVVDREQSRVSRSDHELVDVAGIAVAGADLRDLPVPVVVDGVVAAADAHRCAPAPPGENGFAAVLLHLEVGDAVSRERVEPDDLA